MTRALSISILILGPLLSVRAGAQPQVRDAAPASLASLELHHRGVLLRAFHRTGPQPRRIALDLGVSLRELRLVVRQRAGRSAPLRVEQHELTSVTVMAGGPHIDLLSWKHGRSAPRELARGGRGYALLAPRSAAFPAVTARELAVALRAELRRQRVDAEERAGWLAAARRCTSVQAYPCSVGVSHVVLRVLAGAERRLLAELVLETPLGC